MSSRKSSGANRRKREPRAVTSGCPFCMGKIEPDYKDPETLAKYITDRAKIVGSKYSGVCSKHQRRLSREIKRARHLGLLPFTPKL